MGLTRSLRSLHPPGVWIANRIEVRFTALGYFALEGTDQRSLREQASMIRHYSAGATDTSPTDDSARSSAEPEDLQGQAPPSKTFN